MTSSKQPRHPRKAEGIVEDATEDALDPAADMPLPGEAPLDQKKDTLNGEASPAVDEEKLVAKCGNCFAFMRDAVGPNHPIGQPVSGHCRLSPPIPIFFGMAPSPLAGGAPVPVIQPWFPPTNTDVYCCQWRPEPGVAMMMQKNRKPMSS